MAIGVVGQASKNNDTMSKRARSEGEIVDGSKRLASGFYQLKTWHCISGQYLQ